MASGPSRAELPASRSGHALLRLFAQTDDARLLLDPDGLVILANPRCADLFGWAVGEMVGVSASLLAPDRHRDEYARLRDLVLRSGSGDTTRLGMLGLHRDGHEFRMRVTARAVFLAEDDRVLSMILQPRSGEDASADFRELLEAVPDGNVVVDGDGVILMANAPALAMFGYAEDELVDQPLEMLVPEAQQAAHVRRRAGSQATRAVTRWAWAPGWPPAARTARSSPSAS